MTSTKSEPGAFDGMERAAPDEPVFTLRAHDPLAAALVHEWVRQRREAINGADLPEAKRELELIQCREAEEIAWSMEDWRKGVVAAEANAPKEDARATTEALSEAELEAKHRYDTVKGAVGTLNNAVAEVTEAAGALEPLGFPTERAAILAAASYLKDVSAHIAPKRASYYVGEPMPEPFVMGFMGMGQP